MARFRLLLPAQAADAVLLGAVGGPKYDRLDFSVKPERGLLRLRKEMDLYANLRPAQCFAALADFSSLKRELVAGLDLVIVRELTSGIYFGEPRGIRTEGNQRVGINTQRYTEAEIARVARSAFGLARQRNNRVCSMEKANVMESGILWREVVQEVHDRDFPDVALSHMYADAGAMAMGIVEPEHRAIPGRHAPVVAHAGAPVGIVEPPFGRDAFGAEGGAGLERAAAPGEAGGKVGGVVGPDRFGAEQREGPGAGLRGQSVARSDQAAASGVAVFSGMWLSAGRARVIASSPTRAPIRAMRSAMA
jgi:hypothetical protein